ncbi:MAG TPA: TetR/AcrR family transcriptional regulator [Acidimicrobiales bacterium]|nr:TetR/AcrR family transcriptional regulator [Acidimicrobiales bacterium]
METRDRILAAALARFAGRGYAAVSIEDIAEAAGVTKGAVYYWFADKDDLGRDLQHELYERLATQALAALDPAGDAVSNMRRAFEVYLDALGSLGEARFFLRDAWTIPALDAGGRRDHEDAVAMVRGVLSAAIENDEIVALDPDALARVLLGAWAEGTLHVLTTGERAPVFAVVEHLVESLRNPETTPAAASAAASAAVGATGRGGRREG